MWLLHVVFVVASLWIVFCKARRPSLSILLRERNTMPHQCKLWRLKFLHPPSGSPRLKQQDRVRNCHNQSAHRPLRENGDLKICFFQTKTTFTRSASSSETELPRPAWQVEVYAVHTSDFCKRAHPEPPISIPIERRKRKHIPCVGKKPVHRDW